jgi:hypothetical protein
LTLFVQPSSHQLQFQIQLEIQRASLKESYVQLLHREPWTSNTASLPEWFRQYWQWHVHVRSNETLLQSNTTKFLIVSIHTAAAGGLADRLRSLPLYLYEAYQTQRVFLMEWTRPCAVEELLWPAVGGIHWTVPSDMMMMSTTSRRSISHHKHHRADQQQDMTVWYTFDSVSTMLHQQPSTYEPYRIVLTEPNHPSFVVGMPYMEQRMNISSMDMFYKYVFDLLLTPSPPVQQLLDTTMQHIGLLLSSSSSRPNLENFWAIHLRARYPGSSHAFQSRSIFKRSVDADGFQMTADAKAEIMRLFRHAATCLDRHVSDSSFSGSNHTTTTSTTNGSSIRKPLYFASDTNEAVRYVTQQHRPDNNNNNKHPRADAATTITDVVGMVTPYERFHLNRNDRMGGLRRTPPMAFYPAIVDLWILKQAQCMAIGKGGYGLLAARMGGVQCLVLHQPNDFAPISRTSCFS